MAILPAASRLGLINPLHQRGITTTVGYSHKLANELLDQPVITGGHSPGFLLSQLIALVFLDLLFLLLVCFLDDY